MKIQVRLSIDTINLTSNQLFAPGVTQEEYDKMMILVESFIEDDEFINIEFDTATNSATLIKYEE